MTRRTWRIAAAAAVGVTALALALPQAAMAGGAGSGHGGAGQCALARSTVTATAHVDAGLTERFAHYGDTGGGWTGGDSTFSLPLSGGRLGWFFSDTFLGKVNPDGSRPADAPFVNNSVVVQDAHGLRTVAGNGAGAPAGVVPPEADGRWYWIGDPASGPRGTVQLPLLQFEKTGTGSFDFRWTANRLAILDGKSLALRTIVDLPSATGINWGSWTLQQGATTYIYGVTDVDGVRSAYIARTQGRDGLTGHWTFWNGTRWSASEADAVPITPNVANEFSVAPFKDGYLLVTQDTSELFSTRIVAKVGCSPTGPFTEAAELYRTPETGAQGSYANANVFTYNAHEHPELRRGNRILVTYNVNSFDNVGDVYDDVTIYRPRFVDVDLTVRR
ncbi:MAG: DUF4185 domain-containing protein [Microbacterium sp.]|uniref:DUF4185 domain-containing protein n=1 Tax=Microbacterium sp. TaxID=51671 RepID=UPI001AC27437|nr:DUF4185 domain-containing protein [Microbacterium sp.]MBN9154971.1 DUF4185 domain-containing protein [Microbacterium sp.]